MTEQKEQEKEAKPVSVRVLRVEGASALVERGGARAFVPAKAVKDGTMSPAALARGVPYGAPWERLGEGLAADLRAAGVWTREDLSRMQRTAWQIARAHNADLADLNELAAKEG